MSARRLTAALLGVVLTVGAQQASAQTPEARAQAGVEFQAGVRAFGASSWTEALAHFQQAYRLAPHPSVRVNVANCFLQLGQQVEALTWFEAYLRESEGTASNPREGARRTAVLRQLAELRRQLAEVRVHLEPARAAADAILSVDGQATAIGNQLRMTAGRHVIEVSAEGFQRERLELDLTAGSTRELNVTLRAPEPVVAVVPQPVPQPATPVVVAPVVPQPVVVAPQPVVVVPREDGAGGPVVRRRGLAPWYFAGAAVGTGAFAVAWIVTGSLALGANRQFNNFATANQQGVDLTQDQIDEAVGYARRAHTLAVASDVMMALTLGGAAASVILLTQTRFSSGERPRATVLVLPSLGGLMLAGGFP